MLIVHALTIGYALTNFVNIIGAIYITLYYDITIESSYKQKSNKKTQ